MTALRAQQGRSGLDLDAPRTGRGADAYEVACTADFLQRRQDVEPSRAIAASDGAYAPARHATALHLISGRLHRLAERQCNEDLTCKACGGEGYRRNGDGPRYVIGNECRACAGEGLTTGRTLARLERQAREIAEHYGCRAYFQRDPRGCSLYLVPQEIIPATEAEMGRYRYACDQGRPATLAELQARWVDSCYTRGHAVGRLGR